jgi:hypothetical protein
MRRNHRAVATVEPSWWSHDSLGVAPPDDQSDIGSWDYDHASEAEGVPLLTHSALLRLIEPASDPGEQLPPPAAPEPPPVISAPGPSGESPDPASTQLATCYAMDYLSWDATRLWRRAAALARYLPGHARTSTQPSGWSGRGRQRATFAVPGVSHRDSQDPSVLWIDVRTLITRYEPGPATTAPPPAVPAAPRGELASDTSSAPAPDVPGWRALDSAWIHIVVPLIHDESGQPRVRPDLQPTTHEPADLEQHHFTVVPATVPTEGE